MATSSVIAGAKAPGVARTSAALVRSDVTMGSLPAMYCRLNEVINNPRVSISQIAEVVQSDPGVTARLLRLVNSAFYSFPSRIETISRAIVVVGTQQVRDLVLGTSVLSLFDRVPRDLVTMTSFWRYSIGSGIAARVLATLRNELNVERFFVAGLLHDVGSLVFYTKLPEESRNVLEEARDRAVPVHEIERSVFGFDHATLGGDLLRKWSLPSAMADAVTYHHQPALSRHSLDPCIVHVAQMIAAAMELGSSGDTRLSPMDPRAWDQLGLSPSSLGLVMDQVDRQFEDAVTMILPGHE